MGNTHAKQVFENIDKDHHGKLSLDEIMHTNYHDENFDIRACSLIALFFFDLKKEGTLNLKEFEKLDNYVQGVQKKVKKEFRRKKKVRRHNAHNANNGNIEFAHQHLLPVNNASSNSPLRFSPPISPSSTRLTNFDNMEFDRESTRMFTSYKDNLGGDVGGGKVSRNSSLSGSELPGLVREESGKFSARTSGTNSPTSTSSEDEEEILQQVKSEISSELLPTLHKQLSSEEGRKAFLEWLFKVTDTEHDNKISVSELSNILKAVEQDGIDIDSLLYEKSQGHEQSDLVKRVMSEYSSPEKQGKTEYLSKEEFMVLGDIILKAYTDSEMSVKVGTFGHIGEWELTHKLGEGSYGVVKCAMHSETGEKRAVKIIKRGNVSDMSRLDVEIQAMLMLQHQNVVRLLEVIESEEYIYLFMELCGGGSIYEHLTLKPFEEDLARYYFSQLIDGLRYCHEMGVCHRDLRLENLLLDNDGNLKISDFGQARVFSKGWGYFSTSFVGSLYHLSPEQAKGQCYSGEKIDIWSAGIILYCFLTAKLPFYSADSQEFITKIVTAQYDAPQGVSQEAADLIAMMLQADPEKRASLAEIQASHWMKGSKKHPLLLQYEISIDSALNNSKDILWKCVKEFLSNHEGIHFRDSAQTTQSTLRYAKCLVPSKNLKFSVSLIAIDGPKSNKAVIQFNLREGESLQLTKICDKIKRTFDKLFHKESDNTVNEVYELLKKSKNEESLARSSSNGNFFPH